MACGQPRRARRGRPSGRGPAAVGRLARRASRPPARHLRFSVPPGDPGPEGATGVGACPASPPGREWVVSIKSRPLHRGLGSDSAPAHHLWSPRVSPNPPHTPIQRGAPYRLRWARQNLIVQLHQPIGRFTTSELHYPPSSSSPCHLRRYGWWSQPATACRNEGMAAQPLKSCRPRSTSRLGRAPTFHTAFLGAASEPRPSGEAGGTPT
jgi:hypothetical protein